VTIDGETRKLSSPFMVIATQNPVETQGTFSLPEAQLDRFLIKIDMGYPTSQEGVDILKRFKTSSPFETIGSVATAQDIIDAQRSYSDVFVSDNIYDYIIRLAEATRIHSEIMLGVSPRGTQSLLKAVQVTAILAGRDYVTPDDVKKMIKPVFGHRIILKSSSRLKKGRNLELLEQIMSSVHAPTEEIKD
ncbi:MAG: MoxR family ATPase, partial [Clostridiales bacterium]|nr:MoxR family ATPase [Clostridiales bacterium]